jgi:hypothetical protein
MAAQKSLQSVTTTEPDMRFNASPMSSVIADSRWRMTSYVSGSIADSSAASIVCSGTDFEAIARSSSLERSWNTNLSEPET